MVSVMICGSNVFARSLLTAERKGRPNNVGDEGDF